MSPYSSALAWKIPWMEEPGGLQSVESLESDTTERFHFHFSLSCTGEGNGNPLQCSCLENPRDRGAWWAAIYGVAQGWTRLKQLSSSSRLLRSSFICICVPFVITSIVYLCFLSLVLSLKKFCLLYCYFTEDGKLCN